MNNFINNTNLKPINDQYSDSYWSLSITEDIKEDYKIIDVDWLDPILVKSKMVGDKYFTPEKEEIVNNMLTYYLNHKDRPIYKKTDYLCDKKEKICICNIHAEDFRKIYDGINYKKGEKYISWIKKK
jgi:hypothetical protein